ncbi:hypothetical protein G6F24_012678 [Rhizopus arrhizus]|nr:hypothetical protein G6F24_012678 [Rhizopus arrhizus]
MDRCVPGTDGGGSRLRKGRCIHLLWSWELSPGLGFEVRNGYQSAPALDVFELNDLTQAVDDDPVNAGGNVQVAGWRVRGVEGVYAADCGAFVEWHDGQAPYGGAAYVCKPVASWSASFAISLSWRASWRS